MVKSERVPVSARPGWHIHDRCWLSNLTDNPGTGFGCRIYSDIAAFIFRENGQKESDGKTPKYYHLLYGNRAGISFYRDRLYSEVYPDT